MKSSKEIAHHALKFPKMQLGNVRKVLKKAFKITKRYLFVVNCSIMKIIEIIKNSSLNAHCWTDESYIYIFSFRINFILCYQKKKKKMIKKHYKMRKNNDILKNS